MTYNVLSGTLNLAQSISQPAELVVQPVKSCLCLWICRCVTNRKPLHV